MAAKRLVGTKKVSKHPGAPGSAAAPATPTAGPPAPRVIGRPVFAQATPTPDPTTFLVKHASDAAAYAELDALNKAHKLAAMPFPLPRTVTAQNAEPALTLTDVLGGTARGSLAPARIAAITAAGQIVFHSGGDCGSTKSPKTQELVVDKMLGDFHEAKPSEIPQFHFLLGDIVYSFGETKYYYDQFYEPFRDYPAPILAAAGNHDGMVAPESNAKTLEAFLRNFCSEQFVALPEAGGLSRTAQIQPGVFFTFEAPFVRIITMYSNSLEDPGVIASPEIGNSQLTFLEAALNRVKAQKYTGALIFASHHPTYAGGGRHGGSPEMQAQIDAICKRVGVWPHAVLAGHAHSYQRFTRTRGADKTQIPYVICGNTGHNVQPLRRSGPPIRTPQILQPGSATSDKVVFDNYDDKNYGYLRIIATAAQLRIEYHPSTDGRTSKTPDDSVTVDLKSRTIGQFEANDLGYPQVAKAIGRARTTRNV